MILSALVMVLTGSISPEQITEEQLTVTMTVYISSIISTFGCGLVLGHWSSKRESELDRLTKVVASLEARNSDS